MSLREIAIKRLSTLLLETDACIICPVVNSDGYGEFQLKKNKKNIKFRVHRLSYEIANNVILTTEQIVCHKCDTPACVNPKHLFIGTHNDNVQDRVSKGRSAVGTYNGRYTHGYYSKYAPVKKPEPAFQSLSNRSLSIEKVKEIKLALINKGSKSLSMLSKEFGVSRFILSDILRGKSYKAIS